MIKVILFETGDDDKDYADSLYTVETEYRPVVGDIFAVSWLFGDMYGLEVETIIWATATVAHAYCKPIKRDTVNGLAFGLRGNKGSLIVHTESQIKDFPQRYQEE